MKYGQQVYFESENDEVLNFYKKSIPIDEKYKYIHKNPFYNLWAWFSYRFIAYPFAFITFKLIKKVKIYNKKILNHHKKSGYFIYANHTNQFCDGFCPALICFPKKPHVIVNSVNVALPLIGRLTKMWGALPIPNNIVATRNFNTAIEHTLKHNNPILIYPEAHLWPYYTKIRNFSSVSFRFPIKYNKPVFTFTTIYKKRKYSKKPKVEIYVDGPFYADKDLNEKESQQRLRDLIYSKLSERSKLSNYEYVKYIQKGENQ